MISKTPLIASCACGSVKFDAAGKPILSAVCYCDDCQEGGRQIDALPNAARVQEPDGGTSYLLFRKDRFTCVKGGDLLKDLRIREKSNTRRVLASCCNSGMFLDFEKGHWISAYRGRFAGDVPAAQMRIQTRYRSNDTELPDDLPVYAAFPFKFILKMVGARIAMSLRACNA
jgi:hypothetical protein